MNGKKRILLKVTGTLLDPQHSTLIDQLLQNLITLHDTYHFGIVIGGGNFFRGGQHGKTFALRPATGHAIGMLATVMNGLILKDRMEQVGLRTRLLSALSCDTLAHPISQDAIDAAYAADEIIIFAGGTGNPFFTTDTNAVLRALQTGADAVWKATNVDGIYTADPRTNANATLITKLSHQDAIDRMIGIMDMTALTLAQEYNIPIRVFTLFKPNALLEAAHTTNIGSIIETKDTL